MSSTIHLTENIYAEPFTKRTACAVPGQCGGDCDCGCPYNTMNEVETLPLIAEIAPLFPNEWLAFIVSAAEDDDPYPTHGKLIAHSPSPDDIFDATNTVLWNQCVYTFFNGDFEALEASYGDQLAEEGPTIAQVAVPKETGLVPSPQLDPVPEKLLDLVYSAVDLLYQQPVKLSEAIRRLRIAKMRAAFNTENPLNIALDAALDQLEVAPPAVDEAVWGLEEALADLEPALP